jgi:hypothetical protein
VKAGDTSDPFLFSGFAYRSLHLAQHGAEPLAVTIEVDAKGDGTWSKLRDITVPPNNSVWTEFPETETGAWVRLKVGSDASRMTAIFHYRGTDPRPSEPAAIFDGIAKPGDARFTGALLRTRNADFKTLRCLARDGASTLGLYDLDAEMHLVKVTVPDSGKDDAAWMAESMAFPPSAFTVDAASVLYVDNKGKRWRLPMGDAALGQPGGERICREVSTERNLLNVHGSFYEVPADNAGGFIKVRPVATHNRRIYDFASYRGLLVLSGITSEAKGEHIIRSDDGQVALWAGVLDDLWQFGKARGVGGPWKDTAVKAGVPSDPYLATGYDQKRLSLSHSGKSGAKFRLQADFSGTGTWSNYAELTVPAGKPLEYQFPAGFGAYWLRLMPEADGTATATFTYE